MNEHPDKTEKPVKEWHKKAATRVVYQVNSRSGQGIFLSDLIDEVTELISDCDPENSTKDTHEKRKQ